MKKIKLMIIYLLLVLLPIDIVAYSKYIIPGGSNLGINVHSNGVLIVGFYQVNGEFIAKNAGFEIGDNIIKINNKTINNINDINNSINETNNVVFTIIRNNIKQEIIYNNIYKDNEIIRTGLYIKDKIIGIGTLTYIDPGNKIFGALGHEIDEKTTMKKFEISSGSIFKSDIVDIDRSYNGNAGEKNATYDENTKFGEIKENSKSGIFGDWITELPSVEKLKVAENDEVRTGEAYIKTVIKDNKIEDFNINIIKIDKSSETKNILFEVTDKKLLDEAGGIVQGMSGSPIIQNNMIIGAVTHVVVNDTKKGYGIFITTMLKEGEN